MEFESTQNHLEHKAGQIEMKTANGEFPAGDRFPNPHPRPSESDNSPSPSTLAGEVSSPSPPPLGESIPDGRRGPRTRLGGTRQPWNRRRKRREGAPGNHAAHEPRPVEGAAAVQRRPLGRRPALLPSCAPPGQAARAAAGKRRRRPAPPPSCAAPACSPPRAGGRIASERGGPEDGARLFGDGGTGTGGGARWAAAAAALGSLRAWAEQDHGRVSGGLTDEPNGLSSRAKFM